jgi:hypothetical protein
MVDDARAGLLKFIIFLRYFGSTASTRHDIVRGRSAGNEVIIEFTLLGSLDVQINKKGGLFWFLMVNVKQI